MRCVSGISALVAKFFVLDTGWDCNITNLCFYCKLVLAQWDTGFVYYSNLQSTVRTVVFCELLSMHNHEFFSFAMEIFVSFEVRADHKTSVQNSISSTELLCYLKDLVALISCFT